MRELPANSLYRPYFGNVATSIACTDEGAIPHSIPEREDEYGTVALAGGWGGWGVLVGIKSLSTAPGVHIHPETSPKPRRLLGPGGVQDTRV